MLVSEMFIQSLFRCKKYFFCTLYYNYYMNIETTSIKLIYHEFKMNSDLLQPLPASSFVLVIEGFVCLRDRNAFRWSVG